MVPTSQYSALRNAKPMSLLFLVVFSVLGYLYMFNSNKPEVYKVDPSQKIRAPEFTGAHAWYNTDHFVTLSELYGKVILLNFWSYDCINCLHTLEDLRRLEEKYPDELQIISVHAGKFLEERRNSNVRQAVLRFDIKHPVVNDPQFEIWEQYGVQVWPTVYIIDPEGYAIGFAAGDNSYEMLDEIISDLIDDAEEQETLSREKIEFPLDKFGMAPTVLSYPEKILADEKNDRLFIADTQHHRILITDLHGEIKDIIGNAERAFENGDFEDASFNQPAGMALVGNNLYIADRANHSIRVADLAEREVSTLVGDGEKSIKSPKDGRGSHISLSSPTDIVAVGEYLYVTMTGAHQIWRIDPENGKAERFAGSGKEGILDAQLLYAVFAQPYGITTDGTKLYVADSDVSAIRVLPLDEDGQVDTIVGIGNNEFGDIDGTGEEVRMEDPQGITFHGGIIYVADTLNNKIKQVFPGERTVTTFMGTKEAGFQDGDEPQFDEPRGLSATAFRIFVADTNNNAIRVINLDTRTVDTLNIH